MNKIDLSSIIALRHALHQIPEISGREVETATMIVSFFNDKKGWELIEGIGGHGVLAVFKSQHPGKTLLFRAELDALPITEKAEPSWKSQHSGVSHACGHDGHMAILAGLAAHISANPPETGTILLLFQPAEENGTGAKLCLEHSAFKEHVPDFVFAIHNIPGVPVGQIILKPGTFSASVKSAIVHLHGRTAHASEPELGVNPAFYIADLLNYCKSHEQISLARNDFFRITPTFINTGAIAHGTAAGEGQINLTFRAWSDTWMDQQMQLFLLQLSTLSKEYKIRTSIKYTDIFPATLNDPRAIDMIRHSANANYMSIVNTEYPFRWGEDFGVFTGAFPGALFGLGTGTSCPPLHSEAYDFPDEVIEYGIGVLRGVCYGE